MILNRFYTIDMSMILSYYLKNLLMLLCFIIILILRNPNIKFTVDSECKNYLPFLDCNVNRKNNWFDVSVYRKSTFSGLGLSFFSFCSFNFKVNSIKTLLARAYSICSSYQNFHEELVFLRYFFISNDYPINLFENCINEFLGQTITTFSFGCTRS